MAGPFTPGHTIRSLNAQGTVWGDAGGAAGSNTFGAGYLSELGITNTGTPLCINDELTFAGYHQLCLGANSGGAGIISYSAVGGAPQQNFVISVNGQNLVTPGTVSGMPFAASTAALQSLASTYSTSVLRLDTVIGVGAPPVVYTSSSNACSLNAGAGDGGSQVPTSDGKCWIGHFSQGGADVRDFSGAQLCNYANDATAALQAAANYANSVIGGSALVACPLAVAGQVTLPSSTRLTGVGPLFYHGMQITNSSGTFIPPTYPTEGPTIKCTDLIVGSCLLVSGQGIEIDHLNFYNPQPAPGGGTYSPTVFPPVISTSIASSWAGLYIHDASFTSVTGGIDLEGEANYDTQGFAGSQFTIRDIWFNPALAYEIRLHNIDNTGRISNIDDDFLWYRNVASLGTYLKNNQVGLDLRYAANTQINNYEFFANKTAILFTNSTVTGGGTPKTLAAYNIQFSNIGFNLPCQGIGIGSGNATVVNGGMTSVIAAMDSTGQCGSQNAFFDLSSDNANFSIGPYLRVGAVDTLAAIGGTNSNPSGLLYLDGLDVAGYSVFHTGKPLIKASLHSSISFGTSDKLALRGFTGAGPLIGAGVDSSGTATEQFNCVGGGTVNVSGEGSACLQSSGAGAGANTGAVGFYDNTGTQRGFVGVANATGLNMKCTTSACGNIFASVNGSHTGIVSMKTDGSGNNLVNVTPLPTTPPSGVGSLYVCVDNAGNLYVKSACP